MELFISYSRDDKHWVYELARKLRDEGHQLWIDRDIPSAADWWAKICENIESCECFIYVMTPKCVSSIYCQSEMRYAVALNKAILPLMLKQCEFPPELKERRIQYETVADDMSLDLLLSKIEKGLREVSLRLSEVKHDLAQGVERPSLPLSTQEPTENIRRSQMRIRRDRPDGEIILETNEPDIIIGRHRASAVRFAPEETLVSTQHGKISLINGEYYYFHLSTTNPTDIYRRDGSSERILPQSGDSTPRVQLRAWDTLVIGGNSLVIDFDRFTEEYYEPTKKETEDAS